LISKFFEPVALKVPVDVKLPEHDILTKVPVPLQVTVGPEMIPELATLPAVNVPALSVPELVRVPVVVRFTVLRPPKVPFPTQFKVDEVVTAPVHVTVPELVMLVVLSVVLFIVIQGVVEMIFEYTKNLIILVFVSTSIIPFLLKVPPGVENPSWALAVELPATIPRFAFVVVVGFIPA
jgi:hypothetical protein